MAFDPTTGLYQEEVYHTPGGGPFAGLDIYNAFQSQDDYQRQLAMRTMATLQAMNQQGPNEAANLQNPDYQHAMSTLGISPQAAQQSMTQTPWYQAQQNVQGLSPDAGGSDIAMAYLRAGAPVPSGVLSYAGMQEKIGAQGERSQAAQLNKLTQDSLGTFRKALTQLPPDQALQATMVEFQIGAEGIGVDPSDKLYQGAVEKLQNYANTFKAGQLTAPTQAKVDAATAGAGLANTKAEDLKATLGLRKQVMAARVQLDQSLVQLHGTQNQIQQMVASGQIKPDAALSAAVRMYTSDATMLRDATDPFKGGVPVEKMTPDQLKNWNSLKAKLDQEKQAIDLHTKQVLDNAASTSAPSHSVTPQVAATHMLNNRPIGPSPAGTGWVYTDTGEPVK